MSDKKIIKIGTRGSVLALKQAQMVKTQIELLNPNLECEIHTISTLGDRTAIRNFKNNAGVKGIFTKELDAAIFVNQIDIAVHSMKDVSCNLPEELEVFATLPRENRQDCLIINKNVDISNIKTIGTSSIRRKLNLQLLNPQYKIVQLCGNINTRIAAVENGLVEAIILAVAGVKRIGEEKKISKIFSNEEMIPPINQGIIGVIGLKQDEDLKSIVQKINHQQTFIQMQAERQFARLIEADCQTPIAATVEMNENDQVKIMASYINENTMQITKHKINCKTEDIEKSIFEMAKIFSPILVK